jgi:ribokinase
MKILNFGSINIDLVYRVPHISRAGETLSSRSFSRFAGGKGNNQSIALARAGAPVFHAGKIGTDGTWVVAQLKKAGADTRFVRQGGDPTGQAIIQVADNGENSIVLFPGANRAITRKEIAETIAHFGKNDILLLQNEINGIPEIMETAHAAGMKIWFNPAPFDDAVGAYPLSLVDVFILNEIEAAGLAEGKTYKTALAALSKQFPAARILITLGARGVIVKSGKTECFVAAPKVKAIDTTAAGDTFIGYFAASVVRGFPLKTSLTYACKAAALSVTRKGAADSIPASTEVFARRSR